MVTLHEIFANWPHVVALALALGVMIGASGSAIELVGTLCQRFSSPRAQAFGVQLAHVGKMLEAYGTDVPKLVTNATGWVAQFAKLFGTASVLLLAFGSLVLACAASACGASFTQARLDAETVEDKFCAERPKIRSVECTQGLKVPNGDCADSGAAGAP